MDVEFIFLINENAAVTKLFIELGDIKAQGIIKEKEQAKIDYNEGLKKGKTMAYNEQDVKFPQIKRVKIGQLAKQQQLKISFEYNQPLGVFLNKFWEFDLYPMVDENYVYQFEKVSKDIMKKKINNFSFVYKQDITIEIDIESPITSWKSLTHKLTSKNPKKNNEMIHLIKALLDIKQINNSVQLICIDIEKLNKIIFLKTINQENSLLYFFYRLNKSSSFHHQSYKYKKPLFLYPTNDALQNQKYCITLTFIPKFNEVFLDDAYNQYLVGQSIAESQVIKRGKYIFLINRSGSMSGSRIWKAQKCLILSLKILPQDFEFNIISFGICQKKFIKQIGNFIIGNQDEFYNTEYELMWEECQQQLQETLEQAIEYVINMDADIRGTEILNVFKTIVFNKNYGKMKNTTLNVFLLTDGEFEADPIIDLVKKILMLQLEFTLQDLVKNVVNIQSKDWLKWEMVNIKLQVIKKTLIQKQLIYWKILQLHIYKSLLQILIQLKQLK